MYGDDQFMKDVETINSDSIIGSLKVEILCSCIFFSESRTSARYIGLSVNVGWINNTNSEYL